MPPSSVWASRTAQGRPQAGTTRNGTRSLARTGGPIQQQAAQMPDLSHLDEDELFQLERVLKKALGKPEESSARDANIFRVHKVK